MARRRRRGFQPFRPPRRPPPGTYDPSLDASERAAGRGYNDFLQDTERNRGYAYTDTFDPRIGSIAQLGRDRDDSLFDLTRSRDRGVQDIGTSRGRGEEDYGRSVEELQRNYRFMGNTQRQSQAAAGVRGGAGQQALRKRAANEAFDRVPLDRGIGRLREDLTRDEVRLGEDWGIGALRNQRDYDLGVERATTDYGRASEGFGTGVTRAGRELGEYRLDTNTQRFFQAGQGGYEPPTAPRNEMTKQGQTFRVGGMGGPVSQRTYTRPSGRQLNRKQLVGFVRRRRNNGGTMHG